MRTPCGICSLKTLQKNGVTHLKVPGRTARLEKRLAGLRLVKEALAVARAGLSGEAMVARMMRMREAFEGDGGGPDAAAAQRLACRAGNSCYYPDEAVLKKMRRSKVWDICLTK